MTNDVKYWLSAIVALAAVSYGTNLLLMIPGFVEQNDTFKVWLHAIGGVIFIAIAIVVGVMNSLFSAKRFKGNTLDESLIMNAFESAARPTPAKTYRLTINNAHFLNDFHAGSRTQVLFNTNNPIMVGDKLLFHLDEDYGQLRVAIVDSVGAANSSDIPLFDARSFSMGAIVSNVIVLVQ